MSPPTTTTSSTPPQDIFFGEGNLADLLPDIQLPGDDEELDEEQQEEQEGQQQRDGRRDSVRGSARLTPLTTSQFPLLEETEPGQEGATQPGGRGAGQISTTTCVALRCGQDHA
jgi:hypothetical protein